jgi:hypothetical protein
MTRPTFALAAGYGQNCVLQDQERIVSDDFRIRHGVLWCPARAPIEFPLA